jgi:nitroreductase
MLTVQESIEQRRSIRKFKPDPIPKKTIHDLLEAARLAPSGSNRQPWRFLIVTDKEEKKQLREICLGQAFIEEAPVVFVCCADLNAYSSASRRARMQEFADFKVQETLSGRFADPTYRERMLLQPDQDRKTVIRAAMSNVYIAIEHMVLMATALGLGSCWVGAIGEEGQINRLFNLPDHIVVVAVLPVGYPATVPTQRPRLALEEILLRPLG